MEQSQKAINTNLEAFEEGVNCAEINEDWDNETTEVYFPDGSALFFANTDKKALSSDLVRLFEAAETDDPNTLKDLLQDGEALAILGYDDQEQVEALFNEVLEL